MSGGMGSNPDKDQIDLDALGILGLPGLVNW